MHRLSICLLIAAAVYGQTPSAPMSTTLKVGDTAPDFTLPSTSGKPVTLSEFRGKKSVVLAFFPAAFTGGCTSEMQKYQLGVGTFDCGAILYDQNGGTANANCGLFDSPHHWTFGGCSRMDIDEATQTVACANQSNKTELANNQQSPLQRTMVMTYTGAALNGAPSNPTGLFNQVVEALGGIYSTWGITIDAQ